MRKLIVMTAALLAGTALAAAQGMNQGTGQGGGASTGNRSEGASPAPSQQRNAPAERMGQGAQDRPSGTGGQAQRGQGQDDRPGATTGQGAGQGGAGQAQQRPDQRPSGDRGDMNRSQTDRPAAGERAGERGGAGERAGERGGQQGADTRQGATTGQGAAGARGAVNLSTEQRTQIRTVIRDKVKVQPLTNVNFSVSVGTRVPRDVRYVPIPDEIVSIHPAWRGYYVIVVNEQIVIIEPSSFEIVAVIA